MTQSQLNLADVLNSSSMKPYGKLGQLLFEALRFKLITVNQFERFEEELNLLEQGINRSSNSVPRATTPSHHISSN